MRKRRLRVGMRRRKPPKEPKTAPSPRTKVGGSYSFAACRTYVTEIHFEL